MRAGDETYEFEARVEHESAKAYLVEPTIGEKIWIPKSQVVDVHAPDENGLRVFVVTEWIARQKGLI